MATQAHTSRTGPPPVPVPPTEFTLQPHHVQLLKIFMSLLTTYDPRKLPADFVLLVNRVLLETVAEVRVPPTYQELKAKIEAGTTVRPSLTAQIVREMWSLPGQLQNLEHLLNFFTGIAHP
ncbi:hypothetical protein BDY19DRAFT_989186 [Irpex rosettiformis]|uniref:Uncharacterized protein n=1 Tax=Irpex rosettiformis TaxID=378272 RepID=A0ACB8UHG5_9APHY|nr:hypothetical protein BDY19DRAFT_989186 [Irpex rosettiformis]